MAITDGKSIPLALNVESASPHETRLVEKTLWRLHSDDVPERVIGDKAYDSDELDVQLDLEYEIELIAPNKCNRIVGTQDGRALRRFRRRWVVERFFAWIQNFRRVKVRYEVYPENYLAMVQLASILIIFRQ